MLVADWAVITFTQGPQNLPEIIPSIHEITRLRAKLEGLLGRKSGA